MKETELELKEEYIRLGDALKVAGICGTGGQAKMLVQDGQVKVDGKVCLERGAKIRTGQLIEVGDEKIRVK
jgi:ribosome-associated protein